MRTELDSLFAGMTDSSIVEYCGVYIADLQQRRIDAAARLFDARECNRGYPSMSGYSRDEQAVGAFYLTDGVVVPLGEREAGR